jgi:hypothetical protein
MTRQVTIAFDFDVEPHAVAELFRKNLPNYWVEVGYGAHVNGIPIHTIVVSRRNEPAI